MFYTNIHHPVMTKFLLSAWYMMHCFPVKQFMMFFLHKYILITRITTLSEMLCSIIKSLHLLQLFYLKHKTDLVINRYIMFYMCSLLSVGLFFSPDFRWTKNSREHKYWKKELQCQLLPGLKIFKTSMLKWKWMKTLSKTETVVLV